MNKIFTPFNILRTCYIFFPFIPISKERENARSPVCVFIFSVYFLLFMTEKIEFIFELFRVYLRIFFG